MRRRIAFMACASLVAATAGVGANAVAGATAGAGANAAAGATAGVNAATGGANSATGVTAGAGANAGARSKTAAIADVLADAPTDRAVTVYRSPFRNEGSMDLDDLRGFALVRETRTIRLPAGESRLRFEGVADLIEPSSALVTGLPVGVIEKNRDAHLLSPGTLVAAAEGKSVTLLRSNPRTGRTERVTGTITAVNDGVVFQTSAGVEALGCSGLPETFTFSDTEGLSAAPTLSVLVRTDRPLTQSITLSYLTRGFDWSADYTATLSADGRTMDLGAWVTLANSNGISFPGARTQLVAGRLNRENGDVEPIDAGGPVLAECWPRGSTSDKPQIMQIARAVPLGFENIGRRRYDMSAPSPIGSLMEVAVTGNRVSQEALGDLKLYRVPEPTTVASRQAKQVRLLDRAAIPVSRVYGTDLNEVEMEGLDVPAPVPARVSLRTRNSAASHLGLPLPSGRISLFQPGDSGAPLLLNETGMRDLAVNQDVEIDVGESPDVQVKVVIERRDIDAASLREVPLLPGVLSLRLSEVNDLRRVEISNARSTAAAFELRLQLDDGMRLVRADHVVSHKNGRPLFRLSIPPNERLTVRYRTARMEARPTRD